ncbi:DNA polymerase III subunit delta' [Pasteurella canis]|uniref:DNA polymerase III subunit delta' n=1 Tax=Pasteurella canis TaxID=753 RepID=A0A379EXG3_9PAST|nr:DNA polymerase III subunit delta' [Pasteurella canis]UDW83707.1 DNA polymerase III subunit delta' [Pasteurella canis]SUC11071.1 DNA polymerase III subunit delta' [Pasteurella canis]
MTHYPWLEPDYQQIIRAFQQQHGHHALLFKAEQGLGVEQLLSRLGQWIMCQQPQDQQPCGNCHSCRLFQANHHPDIYTLEPIENKDIGVDQVREVSEKINQHAQQNGNKLVYIKGVERLTEAAANAILKTLEEPRPQTYFLLQAEATATIMPTIYSRCQVHLINQPATEVALNWLQQQSEADIIEIQTALRISYGRPLLALTVLEQGLLEKRKEFLRQFWLFYRKCSPLELLPYFEKELTLQQLDWLLAFLMDALKAKLKVNQHWICQDLAAGITQFSAQHSPQALLKANQIIQKVRTDLTQINAVNQELILLDGLTRLITDVFEG